MPANSSAARGYVPLTPTADHPEWESKQGGAPMTARAARQFEDRETVEKAKEDRPL
ncbi:hypothetical protein [Nocardia rhamnosiphila]